MPLNLEQKKALVAEVHEVANAAHSAIAAEYRGLSVDQMTSLRAKARNERVYVKVVKNTLAKLAIAGTDFECLTEALTGPLVLAFSQNDPGAAARVVKSFSKDNDKLVTKAVAIGGDLYPATDLERLASLPTLEQARGMLLGVFNAPLEQLVRTLAEPAAMLARTLAAQGEKQGAA
ncbi:MAG: 50S ribosomal protein L10 [Gammaproteobacteria bacterium]|nr:50S ribosomal protein L10 [Gammaproteobacteria bacterium]